MGNNRNWFAWGSLAVGFAFLYVPILVLIIFSFNENKLVSVWSGFSTKWYAELLKDERIIEATFLSIKIAAINATLAVVLGTLVAVTLTRFERFPGRALFSGLAAAPLVMPEVIIGISLLLLFVSMEQAIGWPAGRGMTTIIIAHATFTMAYVAVIVQSRLVSMDQSIEEAAMDLGARPGKVFFVITLPIILPALISGWLLSFTLSLDDLVIASFTSGPGATTLPMLVFSKVRLGLSPVINALGAILIVTISIAVIIVAIVMSRAEKERQRDTQKAIAANK